ncbi:MAG: alanine--tRNA ligase [Actinomycetota bacterium]
MRGQDIRRTFLDFFKERGHKILPSASLVPDDPTLLLTVAGMVPFKPYFTGERHMDPPRAASVQKCARTNDIENVGRTARHQTLFEMMGNFSFGDYFKREAIEWAWELSLEHFGMEPDRIWVTVYEKDDEAARIWREVVGLPEKRIVRRGSEDNFWSIAGVRGPGGPNTELFYDRGKTPLGEFDDGDTMMEYYNLVFTESDVGVDGNPIGELPSKNVDTGGGLERTAQLLQDVPTAYETDLFAPIVQRAQDVTERAYGKDHKTDVSIRILAEHARSAMFLIGDGILPSNEGRGYVLRRLIRRAVRHARILGVDRPVMRELVDAAIGVMGDAYPEVSSGRAYIEQVVAAEEEHFRGTMRAGFSMLDLAIEDTKKQTVNRLGGDVTFKLHDTYGFPYELTREIAEEAGLDVDHDEFERLMTEQRERARDARKIGTGRDIEALKDVLTDNGPTTFTGYERDQEEAKLVAIVRDGVRVEDAQEGDEIDVVLGQTPFYPEGGGQVGDRGTIELDGALVEVSDTQRVLGDLIVHAARVTRGSFAATSACIARVSPVHRAATMRSHTATHILHAILRQRLGEHARQAGSLVEPGRLRFDFPHFERVPREVLDEVEGVVNGHLLADESVRAYETTLEEARDRGAMALFEEKYGDIVRVVEVGDYSAELCGGTHVVRTSQIGAVKILGEGSIGSNLRRVEALTGNDAIADFRRSRAVLEHIATLLKSSPEEAPAKVEKLLDDLKKFEQQAKQAETQTALRHVDDVVAAAQPAGQHVVIVNNLGSMTMDQAQKLAGAVRERLEKQSKTGVAVLGTSFSGRAALIATTTTGLAHSPREFLDGPAQIIGAKPNEKGQIGTSVGPKTAALGAALDEARTRAATLLS